MKPEQNSLRHFFGNDKVDAMKKGVATFMTSKEYSGQRAEISERLRTIKWPGAVKKISEQADALLDTPVSEALVGVYSKLNLLNRYLDRDQYDAEEIILVELAEHTVNSTHEPRLEIVLNGKSIGEFKLDIELRLELKGLLLKIQDAKIKEITPGSCKGAGSISFYGKVLVAKKTEDFKLSGPIGLGQGIPIAP